MVGWTNDVERIAIVVLGNLQNDEVEPLLREYFRIVGRENVPHVGVVNHAVVAFNELPEVLVGIDRVAHGGFHAALRFGAFVFHGGLHFLHVLGFTVDGCGGVHFFFLAGGGLKRIN